MYQWKDRSERELFKELMPFGGQLLILVGIIGAPIKNNPRANL